MARLTELACLLLAAALAVAAAPMRWPPAFNVTTHTGQANSGSGILARYAVDMSAQALRLDSWGIPADKAAVSLGPPLYSYIWLYAASPATLVSINWSNRRCSKAKASSDSFPKPLPMEDAMQLGQLNVSGQLTTHWRRSLLWMSVDRFDSVQSGLPVRLTVDSTQIDFANFSIGAQPSTVFHPPGLNCSRVGQASAALPPPPSWL
eukprot:PLAT15575.1.p3 GENE.PLAT15575.1~~PLAT15575.1.p3  ORF type:complete len:206 (+),score=76.67 PLAT15575.1:40-657(+)